MAKSSEDYVEILKSAAHERDEAAAKRAEATSRLARAAFEARIEGVPIRDVALAAGLTKQGLYDVARSHGYDLTTVRTKRTESPVPASAQVQQRDPSAPRRRHDARIAKKQSP